MHTLIKSHYDAIISLILLFLLFFLGYIFFYKKQNSTLNWSIFYGTLFVAMILPVMNSICVALGFWTFTSDSNNFIQMPIDLYFIWLMIWSVIPIYFLKGKYLLILSLVLLWIDILIMPELAKLGVLQLSEHWILGEILLIGSVFCLAYFWAKCSFEKKHLAKRAIFQVSIMGTFIFIVIPHILSQYNIITLKSSCNPFLLQFFIMCVFPGIVAVVDLVQKGEGTPFPYDPTKNLVRNGIYAYIRNPIQWSFLVVFIPLSIHFSSYEILLGTLITLAYTIGVSNFQEFSDMEKRFGEEWTNYKSNVPSWRFLWKPARIPKGTIYFDEYCEECNQLKIWFEKRNSIHLNIESIDSYPDQDIQQVTYIDYQGKKYRSISAIAHAFEHINLAYASLGWFMRFPGINYLFQTIINALGFGQKQECRVK